MWLAVGTVEGVEWSGAAGFSNLQGTVDAEIDDAVHMASITKSFTAVAALRLVEQGRLSLDARVVDLLGEEDVGSIPYIDEIRVGQLLDHSSGIYGFNNDPRYLASLIGAEADEGRVWTASELIALAYEGVNEPFGRPGEGHYYGDTNYVLAGLLVEAVTGRPLKAHVSETILRPLGLLSTFYLSDYVNGGGRIPGNTARGYLKLSDELLTIMPVHDKFRRVRSDLAETTAAGESIDAAAGLVTTVGDLHAFGRALFGGRLLGPATHAWLMSVAEDLDTQPVGSERLGALRAYHKPYGIVLAAEGDGPGGSNSVLAFHPASGVVVAALTNIHGLWFENRFFLDEVVAEAVGASPVARSASR